jgi:hypothetical protein
MRANYILAADFVCTQNFGHMLLVAHDPQTYDDIATETIEAASEFLKSHFASVEFTVHKSEKGLINAFTVACGSEPCSTMVKRSARLFGDPNSEEARRYVQARLVEARKWIRCHRWPSYLEVFRAWVSPEDWSKLRPAQKKWTKLNTNIRLNIPAIDLVQSFLLTVADITTRIPTGLTRWSGLEVIPISRPLATNAYMVELFVWFKMVEVNKGRNPSYGEFGAALREGPMASITDLQAAYNTICTDGLLLEPALAIPNGLTPEERAKAERVRVQILQGRMWVLTLVYGLIDFLNGYLRMNRFLGFFLALFFFMVRDLDKAYSLIHLAYWLDTGRASVGISNMSPRDPFIAQKMLALAMVVFVPLSIYRYLSFIPDASAWVRSWAERFYVAWRLKTHVASETNKNLASPGTVWDELRGRYLTARTLQDRPTKIIAGMGSGKSTSLPMCYLEWRPEHVVVVICPTLSLAVNYRNPFLAADRIQLVLQREDFGVPGVKLFVITATRLMGMIRSIDPQFKASAMWMFDEAHESLCEQLVVYGQVRQYPHMLLSGTPRGLFWSLAGGQEYVLAPRPGRARDIVVHDLEGRMDPAQARHAVEWVTSVLAKYRSRPEFSDHDGGRFAVYHPSLAICSTIRRTLEASGFEAHLVHSGSPAIPTTGVVVGTFSIVTGVNFHPPMRAMLDVGVAATVEPSYTRVDGHFGGAQNHFMDAALQHRLRWSTDAVRDQVAARVGREIDGVVYRPSESGTGVSVQWPVPSILALLEFGDDPCTDQYTVGDVYNYRSQLVVNPHVQTNSIDRFLWSTGDTPELRVHRPMLHVTFWLATELGSLQRAMDAMRLYSTNPVRLDPRLLQVIERLIATVVHRGDFSRQVIPLNYRALMLRVGTFFAPDGVGQICAGRPLVAHYVRAQVGQPALLIVSPSGWYAVPP